ncbi:MAG TPA: ATP-binding protein [Bryobacteraceae bacterium]|nr:ATP-binding protein [Bryobacteraceae bacterium]
MGLLRRIRSIPAQDVVWLLLFGGLLASSPNPDVSEGLLLAALAAVQIAEPKVEFLSHNLGKVLWIMLKLLLGYLLIGYTGGLVSRYYLILLLPVVSAATAMSVVATLLFTLLACGAYLSYLLFIDWSRYILGPPEMRELLRRAIFLAVAGNLANALAEALRVQSGESRRVAAQLAEANRSLHEAEAAVRRSDRLAALGQLAAGLAHELRNPLGTMKASAEMLARSISGENEVAREMAGFISSEADRTNSLITRFLDFARPLKLRLEPADLGHVLDQAVGLMERDSRHRGVTVYKNYSPDIPPFPLDAELMERVFYNLLLNAAQATPEGGAVTVKTRSVPGGAEVAVIDRGCGIEPKLIDTIFNPFVTTKPDGVGLGLAIVSRIVDQHGGKIAVESEPGKGSVFRVFLPTSLPEAPTP